MIGIIAGDGSLPKLIVKKLQNKKINHIVINLSKKKKTTRILILQLLKYLQ
jgi:DUF1009 family protein